MPQCWQFSQFLAVAGMQDIDKQTSQALLEFSYHLAIGDTNEAYKVEALLCSDVTQMCRSCKRVQVS